MELEFRSFDKAVMQLAGGASGAVEQAVPDNLTFTQQGAFDVQVRGDLFLTPESFDAGVLAKMQTSARLSRGLPVGMAELRDVHVHLLTGIVFDTGNRCLWQGWLLNWNAPVLGGNLMYEFGGAKDAACHVFDDGELRGAQTIESAVLIISAGYRVYGHWLLDHLPRIGRVADSVFGVHQALRLPEKTWARTLTGLFAPACRFVEAGDGATFVKVERLLVPTTARAYGALEEHSMRSAWTRLNDILKQGAPAGQPSRRLFVSRQMLREGRKNNRAIGNMAAVERLAVAAGFEAVHPETLSFAEQQKIFSEASVVVGEDGSGLHNAIFCRPGARLGVISTDRKNTLHAMIANIRELHITYIAAQELQGGADGDAAYRVHPRDFKTMLGVLLAGH